MGKEVYLRILRRIGTAILVLLLLLFANTPVLADEAQLNESADSAQNAAQESSGDPVLTEENFAAVAAQLEAVAREEGRTIANKMLYESFRVISPVAAPAAEETVSVEPTAAPAQNTPAVVVHAAEQNKWSFSGLLPFFAVVALAMLGMLAAVLSARHRQRTGRRPTFSRSYRPMHDMTFRADTLEKRSALRLNR